MAATVAAPAATGTNTKLAQLHALGQSVWLDFISRDLIRSGELQRLVDEGVLGMTSNPTIFEKAIAGSADYDDQLAALARQGKSAEEIYEALAIDDIRAAAGILRPVYDRLNAADGYVSLEVSPLLAHDTEGTIGAAARLFATVGCPNVMIKIPATVEGLPAITASIAAGINVNVTLLFDVDRYEAVTNAFLAGLEQRVAAGRPIDRIASVASFFVSRVDTAIDAQLEGRPEHAALRGTAAVANAIVAYERFERIFGGERFAALRRHGARAQRVLWASTSTKNPAYPETKYVDPLIGPHTVNTVPAPTLQAIKERANVRPTIQSAYAKAHAQLDALRQAGIDLKAVTAQLERDGVEAFAKSYRDLLASIAEKAARVAR